MKKVFPNASIEKDIIGEIVGFDREDKSDACELISSLTGDNSRQVVSFGTEAGYFKKLELALLFVVLAQLNKLIKLMSL